MAILTYVYYGLKKVGEVTIPDPDQYMIDLHKIVESDNFKHVDYCGQMNCSCGGREEFGLHYGMIFIADKEKTKEILSMIENDYQESFDMKTMDKLTKDLEKVELDFWDKKDSKMNAFLQALESALA